jgi:hypothetical protein
MRDFNLSPQGAPLTAIEDLRQYKLILKHPTFPARRTIIWVEIPMTRVVLQGLEAQLQRALRQVQDALRTTL